MAHLLKRKSVLLLLASLAITGVVLYLRTIDFGPAPASVIQARDVSCLVYSPDGKMLAWASIDGLVVYRNLDSGITRLVNTMPDQVHDIRFSRTGKLLAAASWDGTVSIWKGPNYDQIASLKVRTQHQSLCFLDEQRLALGGHGDGSIVVWTFGERDSFSIVSMHVGGATNAISRLCVSPDLQLFASSSMNGTFIISNPSTWDVLHKIAAHSTEESEGVQHVSFSPTERTIATFGPDDHVRIWGLGSGNEVGDLHTGTVIKSMDYSPNGRLIAVAGIVRAPPDRGVLSLWDVATSTKVGEVVSSKCGFTRVAFSPDGKTLATASSDNLIKIWRLNDLLSR